MERKKFIYKFSNQHDYENTKKSIRTRPYVVFIDDIDEVIFEDIIDYSKEYFTINVLENGTINLLIPKDTISYKYRINKNEWVETNEDVTLNVASNDEIEINCVCTKFENEKNNSLFNIPIPFNVYGNVMSLLFGDDFENKFSLEGRDKAFYSLFYKCSTLIDAENLILQATTLYDNCYRSMFNGCSNLIRVPELPATTLASNCYYMMFRDCTSLTEAPELYATTLANGCCMGMFAYCTNLTETPQLLATTLANECYREMFYKCTSLTKVPSILPATILTINCYYMMFYDCTSITKAPQLPATTLADYCYNYMFDGCTSLTEAPELLATTLARGCYMDMFYRCTSLTKAPQLPATTLASGCYTRMFVSTKLIETPELPATTLASSCYSGMFRGCTSLTKAPQLPATTLADNCYNAMFEGTNVLPDCSNIDFSNVEVVDSGGLKGLFYGTNVTYSDLEKILPKNKNGKCYLPCTTFTKACYSDMFKNCKKLTEAPQLPATTLANSCYSGMFIGCISLTKAPQLPATTITKYCYERMFYGCTSLTEAPQLLATTLAVGCYSYMFYDCSKLNHIEMLALEISASDCLIKWVSGVSSSGTFIKHKEMTSLPKGINGIPQGWAVEDYV